MRMRGWAKSTTSAPATRSAGSMTGSWEQPAGRGRAALEVERLAGQLVVTDGELEPGHEVTADHPTHERSRHAPGRRTRLGEPEVDVRLAAGAEPDIALPDPADQGGGAVQLGLRPADERVAEI